MNTGCGTPERLVSFSGNPTSTLPHPSGLFPDFASWRGGERRQKWSVNGEGAGACVGRILESGRPFSSALPLCFPAPFPIPLTGTLTGASSLASPPFPKPGMAGDGW